MTRFEELANELNHKIQTKDGFYTGKTEALSKIACDVILDDETMYLAWERQKELIKEKFYKTFPYMRNAE